MFDVSVICQEIDRGLLAFIKNINSEKSIRIKRIIVAPFCEMHALRRQQIKNRSVILNGSTNTLHHKFWKQIVLIFKKLFIIKIIFKILLIFENRKNGLDVFYADENWDFHDKEIYEDTAIIYSLEGLLTEVVIHKFVNGIINIHPAILPDYRGLDASLWALYENEGLGVTSYVVNKGIDTGSIIKRFPLNISANLTILNYLSELKKLKYKSYTESIIKHCQNEMENDSPMISRSQNRGVMPKEVLTELITKYGTI